MFTYLIKRLFEIVPTLFGITLISFFIIHLAPGKPTDIFTELNPKITPEAREKLEKYYGLDKPIIVQYGIWLKRVAKLDFGESFSADHRPVREKIWDHKRPLIERRLFVTFMINLLSLVIIMAFAVPIGISSATRRNSLYDKIMTTTVFLGFAMPSFWFALLLMMLFGVHLHWLPISQLKSMLDKRAQWVEDFSILCEAVFEDGNVSSMPNYFHYTVYDKGLEVITEFDLLSEDMLEHVWPYMDTDDIPFFEGFKQQFISYYGISPEDMTEWERTIEAAKAG